MMVGFIGGKFLPLHQGHVYSILQASTRVDKLYVILSHSEKRDRDLCERCGCKYIPYQTRLSWLHQLAKNTDHIVPVAIEDEYGDDDYDWEDGARKIKEKIKEPIDIIFGSDPEYKEIFSKLYPDACYTLVDHDRSIQPVSGTKVRNDPYKHWDMLPSFVRPFFVKKVVVVGTESCGKSTLVSKLAQMYNTVRVEEHGRNVCEENGGPETLTEDMYRRIAYGHKLLEYEAVQKANKLLLVDTEAVVTEYYAGLYNGYSDPLFGEMIKHEDYDLWLFLEPDVTWVDDGQRRHGSDDARLENNRKLKSMLDGYGIKYVTISGNYEERLQFAMDEVDALFKKS